MKALLTAAAALAFAASASAATVTVGNYTHHDLTGDGDVFEDVKTLTLGSDTWVKGFLTTDSKVGGVPQIDITSVTFRRLDGAANLSWTETVAIDWDNTLEGFERWTFGSHLLGAGVWQLEVDGVSWYDKSGQGYTASVELPEPGSVALAALALAGAGLVSARRRKA